MGNTELLGFAPISSTSISGAPFKLVAIATALAASGASLTFGGTANGQWLIPMAASGSSLLFGGSANPKWTQNISASGTSLLFGGSAILRLSGISFAVVALPDSYEFRSDRITFEFTSIPDQFTFRGGSR